MSKLVRKSVISNFGKGIKNDVSPVYIEEGFVPDAYNVDFSYTVGGVRKRKGYARVNSAALDSGKAVTGIYQTWLGGIAVQLVCAGDKIHSWNGATTFTSKNSANVEGENYLWDFCTTRDNDFGFSAYMTNGYDGVQRYAVQSQGSWITSGNVTFINYDGSDFTNVDSAIHSIFRCRHIAQFKNYCIFADTTEANNLANDWTNTTGTYYKYNNAAEDFVSGLEIAGVYQHLGAGAYSALTEETVTPTTPGVGEYGIEDLATISDIPTRLWVNINGAPGTNIIVAYRCRDRIRWSALGCANKWVSGNFTDLIAHGTGRDIVRVLPLRDLLMIYKNDSIWAGYQTGDPEAPFGFYCVDSNTPCYAGFSVADVRGEHFFLSKEGIMKTDGAQVSIALASKNISDSFDQVNIDTWKYAYAASDERLKQYRLLVPGSGTVTTTKKTRELRYDYENEIWSIHGYSTPANVISVVQVAQDLRWNDVDLTWDEMDATWNDITQINYPRFYTGCYAGFVRRHDVYEYDEEASAQAINAWFKTKPLNLANEPEDISKNKSLLKLRALLDSFTGSTLTVEISKDGGKTFSSLGTINLDNADTQFVGKIDMLGTCKELIYKFSNTTASTPFCVYWIQTEYLVRSDL